MKARLRNLLGCLVAWALDGQHVGRMKCDIVDADSVLSRHSAASFFVSGPGGYAVHDDRQDRVAALSALAGGVYFNLASAQGNTINMKSPDGGSIGIRAADDSVGFSFTDARGAEHMTFQVMADGTASASISGFTKIVGIYCQPGQEPTILEETMQMPDRY